MFPVPQSPIFVNNCKIQLLPPVTLVEQWLLCLHNSLQPCFLQLPMHCFRGQRHVLDAPEGFGDLNSSFSFPCGNTVRCCAKCTSAGESFDGRPPEDF